MFAFNTTPALLAGPGSSARIGSHLPARFGQRLLVVTDKGLVAAGLVAPILADLQAAGMSLAIFDAVSADPPEAQVLAGLALAKAHDASGVLGLGGGSPMDVAKVVALLAGGGELLDAIYGIGQAKGPRLPLALIPTTAGTGSEVTPIAILTTGEAEKKGIVSPLLLPDLAILDADLTLGLPKPVSAATGIDAMVHAIEAYSSRSPNNNPLSRGLARQALALLGANLPKVCANGQDREARQAMLLGSMLAGQAFANSPVAAVHALAYPLGGHFHLPHGLSNALVLPHVLRFNLPDAAKEYVEIAADAFPDLAHLPHNSRALAFIERLQALSREIGLPASLAEVGIGAHQLERLAEDAMKQTRLLVNNPRPLTKADALAIYQAAYVG